MRNRIQEGEALDLIAPSGGVTAGVGVLIGSIFSVAVTTVAAGGTFVGCVEGVFELAAAVHASNQAIAVGGPVYWDDTAKACTATAAGNTLIGSAVAAKVSTVALVKVKLTPRLAAAGAAIADLAGGAVVGTVVTAFNTLLAELRAAGIILA